MSSAIMYAIMYPSSLFSLTDVTNSSDEKNGARSFLSVTVISIVIVVDISGSPFSVINTVKLYVMGGVSKSNELLYNTASLPSLVTVNRLESPPVTLYDRGLGSISEVWIV